MYQHMSLACDMWEGPHWHCLRSGLDSVTDLPHRAIKPLPLGSWLWYSHLPLPHLHYLPPRLT